MDTILQEISNVGITLLVVVMAIVLVKWLDDNYFNNRK